MQTYSLLKTSPNVSYQIHTRGLGFLSLSELIRHILTLGHVRSIKAWYADNHSKNILQIVRSLHIFFLINCQQRKKTLIMQQRKLVFEQRKKYIATRLNPKMNDLYFAIQLHYQVDKSITAISTKLLNVYANSTKFQNMNITRPYQFRETVTSKFILKEILCHVL